MTIMTKILVVGLGGAAIAAAAPATAQYGYGYGYGNRYGGVNTQALASRCAAAVQNRLSVRGGTGILGSLFGIRTRTSGQVLAVTRVDPRRSTVRVRGVATSGRYAYNPYGQYGYGAYGALGYAYAQPQADLSFRCDIDYRGRIRDIDINRRR